MVFGFTILDTPINGCILQVLEGCILQGSPASAKRERRRRLRLSTVRAGFIPLFGVDATPEGARDERIRWASWCVHASQEMQQCLAFGVGEAHQPLCLECSDERQH